MLLYYSLLVGWEGPLRWPLRQGWAGSQPWLLEVPTEPLLAGKEVRPLSIWLK